MSPNNKFTILKRQMKRTVIANGIFDICFGVHLVLISFFECTKVYNSWYDEYFFMIIALLWLTGLQVSARTTDIKLGLLLIKPTNKQKTIGILIFLLVIFGIVFASHALGIQSKSVIYGAMLCIECLLIAIFFQSMRFLLYSLLFGSSHVLFQYMQNKLSTSIQWMLSYGILSGIMIVIGIFLIVSVYRLYPAQTKNEPDDLI